MVDTDKEPMGAPRPPKHLTILCDACSIRNNPYLGEQLQSLMGLLKDAGVQCHYLQDRMGLVESAGIPHELFLESVRREQQDGNRLASDASGTFSFTTADVQSTHWPTPDPAQAYTGGDGKVHKSGQTYIKKNYQRFLTAIESVADVRFMDSPVYHQWLAEETRLTQQHLFNDERFGRWNEARDVIAGGEPLENMPAYYVGLYHTCNTASHLINAINRKLRSDPTIAIDPALQASLGLDKYPPRRDGQDTHYHWTDIRLEELKDAATLPMPVVKGFMQSAYTLDNILGRGKHILPAGKQLHDHYLHAGEACMQDRTAEILSAPQSMQDNYVMLITDDGPAYKKLKTFSEQHKGRCETLCSAEVAKEVLRLYPRLQTTCAADALQVTAANAKRISDNPWNATDERGNMLKLYDPPAQYKMQFTSRGSASVINTMLGGLGRSAA